jgi:hypothetical protein
VAWRAQVEEYMDDDTNGNNDFYSVKNLIPLFNSSLEIISILRLSVKTIKQLATKKRKRVRNFGAKIFERLFIYLSLQSAINDTLPKVTLHVEKFNEEISEMIDSHHIETTVNSKELERKIQQRLQGKKPARKNNSKKERDSHAQKLINIPSNNENQWGSVVSELSSELEDENNDQVPSDEEGDNRAVNYYEDESDDESLDGDQARIDEFHVSA